MLPISLTTRADDAKWFVSTVTAKTASGNVDPWDFVRLSKDILQRVMDQRTYSKVIKCLASARAIEVAGYWAGVKCKGYKLAERYLTSEPIRVNAVDTRLIERIQAEDKRLEAEQRKRWLPVHDDLKECQKRLTITRKADTIIDSLENPYARLGQDILVGNLRDRSMGFTVGKTRRVFNGATGMKKVVRECLLLGGDPVGSVDIVNSQPALLGVMLMNGLAHVDASELGRYCEVVYSGCFYELLMELTGLPRPKVKKGFLRDVVAKRGRYSPQIEAAFAGAFPSIHRAIRHVNRDDHGTLIRLLQCAEADLVIGQVTPLLIGAGVDVVTVHDELISRRSDVPTVKDTFVCLFDERGYRLKIK